ncbi:hypothetical protein [Streptomyces phaeochromogenes]|uniref:hypothetical protein n=1 Tax=Streptomyces phaeochromogenes TaxID=1923 RepID=UPI002DDBF5C6|nr:hypothetical protein [Streptomyces phaeochromogenes]WRZ31708.1 hypothetical protein OG931_30205 [Streptomyces phaeochromogenes]
MTGDPREYFVREFESMPRSDHPQFVWDPQSALGHLRDYQKHHPDGENSVSTAAFAHAQGERSGEALLGGTWAAAQFCARLYVIGIGRQDLTPFVADIRLAVSATDRWTTLHDRSLSGSVVNIDYGLLGAHTRLARCLGAYWAWEYDNPLSVAPQRELVPADAAERFLRLYFRDARRFGFLAYRYHIFTPSSGTQLTSLASTIATVFALCHEISHALIETDATLGSENLSDVEMQCDALAASMIALLSFPSSDIGTIDPCLISLGITHHFQTLKCLENACFMIRPGSHPENAEREGVALAAFWELLISSDTVRYSSMDLVWSDAVYAPVRALVDLVVQTPPWGDPDRSRLTECLAKFPQYVKLTEVQNRNVVDALEWQDLVVHTPPDRLAQWFAINVRLAAVQGGMPDADPDVLIWSLATLPSPQGGWRLVDRFMEANAEALRSVEERVEQYGLTHYGYLEWEQFRRMGPVLGYYLWCLCAIRLGWDSRSASGNRMWGEDARTGVPGDMVFPIPVPFIEREPRRVSWKGRI